LNGLRALALAGLLALAGGAAAQAQEPPQVPDAVLALVRASDKAATAKDYRAAADRLAEALGHPEADQLSPKVQRRMHTFIARYAAWGDDLPRGLKHARLATGFEDTELEDWTLRAFLARDVGLPDEAADSWREAYRRWPEQVRREHELDVAQAVWPTDFDSPARFALLKALREGGFEWAWTGPADGLWLELALQHLARGEQEAAREIVATLTEPRIVIQLLADRRFDAVRDPALTPAALPRLARQRADDLRARALLDANVVGIQAEYASALLMLGEHEDVVALAEQVATAIADSPFKGDIYIDQQEQLAWLYDRAGQALVRLGRKDEAIAMYRRAAGTRELGAANVSQVLNLAHHLVSAGQPREALDVVASVGNMSPFGRMVLVGVQHRAALALGDGPAADAALDYLQRNRGDGEGVYTEALLDRGQDDAAAAALVENLENPEKRLGALYSVQRFLGSASLDPARDARQRAMHAREDVQAAVERHGRTLDLPLYEPW